MNKMVITIEKKNLTKYKFKVCTQNEPCPGENNGKRSKNRLLD